MSTELIIDIIVILAVLVQVGEKIYRELHLVQVQYYPEPWTLAFFTNKPLPKSGVPTLASGLTLAFLPQPFKMGIKRGLQPSTVGRVVNTLSGPIVSGAGGLYSTMENHDIPWDVIYALDHAVNGPPKRQRQTATDALFPYPGQPTETMTEDKKPKAHSTKMSGVYRGKFKRGRKPTGNPYLKYGYEIISERRGEESDLQLIGVGHGSPIYSQYVAIVSAIYRQLLKVGGWHMSDWQELTPYPIGTTFHFQYKKGLAAGGFLETTATSVALETHQTMASKWALALFDDLAQIAAPGGITGVQMYRAYTQTVPENSILLTEYNVHLSLSSVLVIQNRTTGATGTDNSRDDVTANPLTLRRYECRGNGALIKNQVEAITVKENILLNGQDGIATGVGVTAGGGAENKIPRPGVFKNVLATSRGTLDPGAIKKSKVVYRKQMTLCSYFNALMPYILARNNTALNGVFDYSTKGKSAFFFFEKLCDIGNNASPIKVGWEHNYILGAYCVKKRTTAVRRLTSVI